MARALSLDLRERVIAAVEAGASCGQAAERFGVAKASAIRWHAKFRGEGEIAAKPMGGDRHSHGTEAHAAAILQAYEARLQIYLREVKDALEDNGATAGLSGTSRFFRLTASPAKGDLHAAEQGRPDVTEAREAWFEGQLDLDPERVVLLDETATTTDMERRCGRAPRGERCRIGAPHCPYKTTTVTVALRASGPFAVHLLDGATNGARFLSYVTDMLVPALTPGDMVVMDDLAAHKVAGARQAIEAVGAHLRCLPAYGPDFDPIEQAFAKLKALPRTMAARTVPDLWEAVRNAFTRFKPDECRNHLAAAGYHACDPT